MQDIPHEDDSPRRLTRGHDGKIGGVCSGLAEYFGVDATLVRLGFVLLVLMTAGGGGVLAYIVLWLVMPEPDEGLPQRAASVPGRSAAGPRGDSPLRASNGRVALAVIVLVVGVLAIGGLPVAAWMHGGLFRFSWPVALLIVAVLLVVAMRRRR